MIAFSVSLILLFSVSFVSAGFWDWWTADSGGVQLSPQDCTDGCTFTGMKKNNQNYQFEIDGTGYKVLLRGYAENKAKIGVRYNPYNWKVKKEVNLGYLNIGQIVKVEGFKNDFSIKLVGFDKRKRLADIEIIPMRYASQDPVVIKDNFKNTVWDVDKSFEEDERDSKLIASYLGGFSDNAKIVNVDEGLKPYREYLDNLRRNCLLDVDGDGLSNLLTDGILIARYIEWSYDKFRIDDALGDMSTRTNAEEIWKFMESVNEKSSYCRTDIVGDFNKDGRIENEDLNDMETCLLNGDINGDGVINTADLNYIRGRLVP